MPPKRGDAKRKSGSKGKARASNGQSSAIREARLSDAGALAPLSGQLGYPATTREVGARLERLLGDPAQGVFVVEVEREIGGWIHVVESVTVESGPAVEIRGLVVDEAQRGGGLGRALVERGEAWARQRGVGTMTVRSNVVRAAAHAFYQHLGYAVVKTQHAFRKQIA
jgi:GNAT superfamily N-acetyltransferase